jgi:hypothetical protein
VMVSRAGLPEARINFGSAQSGGRRSVHGLARSSCAATLMSRSSRP